MIKSFKRSSEFIRANLVFVFGRAFPFGNYFCFVLNFFKHILCRHLNPRPMLGHRAQLLVKIRALCAELHCILGHRQPAQGDEGLGGVKGY